MNIIIKLFCLILISVSTVFSQRNYSFGWHDESIKIDQLERHFRIFIPRELPNRAPILFIFHSSNSGMENVFNTGDGFNEWPNLAEREKFIIIAPNGVNPVNGETLGSNQKWNDCRKKPEELPETNDVQFVEELIDWSQENLDINENRVYISGIENGGMMVYRLMLELGEKIAGAAVFFANMPEDSECTSSEIPIPIFIMNSKDDPLVPYNGGMLAGDKGKISSAEATLNYWVSLNHLNTQKRTTKLFDDINPNDNSRIIKNEFDRPLENPPVVFNVIINAGHVVPSIKYGLGDSQLLKILGNQNRDLEAVVEAWKFLKGFEK
ncbi:MAG: hypothetical protein C4543_05280 [Ignavibacteriales bacterium]|nr:MAG: hypothetical protein C4543_05280 [Ignavibacteriales bacterium]